MKDELLFKDNFFVSKSMKQIDSSVGYKNEIEQKLVKNLIDCNKDKTKDYYYMNQNEDINLIKRKKEEEIRKRENSKNNTHQLNIISSNYNLQFLPRISPYIKNIDNYLIMDYKKADKLGSKGFEYIWKQAHLRKLSNIKTKGLSDKNKKEKTKSIKKENKTINNDEDEEQLDIFNLKYNNQEKKCDEYIKLKQRLNRILNENKKVKKIFDFHKALSLKLKIKKIYHPKYESIEKHKPEIRLNNKTRRIFPDNFIKKPYYSEKNNLNNKLGYTTININRTIKNNKFNNNITPNQRKTFYICSSLSYDSLFYHNNNDYENNEVKNNMKSTKVNFYRPN